MIAILRWVLTTVTGRQSIVLSLQEMLNEICSQGPTTKGARAALWRCDVHSSSSF